MGPVGRLLADRFKSSRRNAISGFDRLVSSNALIYRHFLQIPGYRRNGITIRQITAGSLELSDGDGMIDYSRTRFNRLASHKDQDAYIARLKAQQYFYVNGWVVPKLFYAAIRP